MAFNVEKFESAKYKFREEDVPVPELKDFFNDGDKLIWKVRNLEGHEIAELNQKVQQNKNLSAVIDGLVSDVAKEKVGAIKETLGISEKTPDDLVRRHAALRIGSVDPVISQVVAVKLAAVHPTIFFQLTEKIYTLTGLGKILG